jgi:hypothetical protein
MVTSVTAVQVSRFHSEWLDLGRAATNNNIPLFDLQHERLEHRLSIEPMIVMEAEPVKVALWIVTLQHCDINANPTLHEPPRALNGVGMHIANDRLYFAFGFV